MVRKVYIEESSVSPKNGMTYKVMIMCKFSLLANDILSDPCMNK